MKMGPKEAQAFTDISGRWTIVDPKGWFTGKPGKMIVIIPKPKAQS